MKTCFRKSYLIHTLLVCLPLLLFSAISQAEDLSAQQADIQRQIQEQKNDPALHQRRLQEAQVWKAQQASRTPDQVAEDNFNNANMIINERGEREVRPKATGQRQVINSRLAVNEMGQIEGIPDDNEMSGYRKSIEKTREHNRQAIEQAGLHFDDFPSAKAQIQKEIKEGGDEVINRGEKQLAQWEKDKNGETPKYEVPKVLVSVEKQKAK